MIMLPQAVHSPMDSDSLPESSLPPDICLKSCSATDEPVDSNAWKDAPQCWPENQSNPITESKGNNVSNESECMQAVAQSDLLQSTCPQTTDQEKSVEESCPVSGALPDLCEGASSSRLSSDSDLSQASPLHHRVPQTWEQNSSSSTDVLHTSAEAGHQALGAKPKVFKYKTTAKRTDLDKGSHSVLKTSSKKGCRDKTRTIDPSHVHSSVSKQDSFDNSRIDSKVQLKQGALASAPTSSNASSVNEDESTFGNLPSNGDEKDIDVLENKSHCDEPKDNTFRPESDEASEKCTSASAEILSEEESPSLMEEYLLYDSRPISLVACGIWDCDSRSGVADSASKGLSGLVLMRNNLHSASDPMFAKWPCEAYIPSHILVEVAFNSHGTSLGAAAGGGAVGGGYGDSDSLARENEQVKLAKRMALIQHLPQGTVDAGTSVRECVICMMDLIEGERVRYLPCMHLYHTHCIDDWFQRAFTCPSCLEPVDAALLNTYNTT